VLTQLFDNCQLQYEQINCKRKCLAK